MAATASTELPTEEAKPVEEVPVPETPRDEIQEEKKEDVKAAPKVSPYSLPSGVSLHSQAKAEKTKVESKGFFAKFFGNKDKSPKKEKKAKTPKVSRSES